MECTTLHGQHHRNRDTSPSAGKIGIGQGKRPTPLLPAAESAFRGAGRVHPAVGHTNTKTKQRGTFRKQALRPRRKTGNAAAGSINGQCGIQEM